MNFELPFLPERSEKPRENGITMMMDKGLSNRQTEYFIDSCGHLMDLVKFGFGTSYITKNLKIKLAMYREADIKCYLGGTLFEAFAVRGMFDDYRRLLDDLKLDYAEVSDGCIHIPEEEKLSMIVMLLLYLCVPVKWLAIAQCCDTSTTSKTTPTSVRPGGRKDRSQLQVCGVFCSALELN